MKLRYISLLALLPLAAVPAVAGTRDDVMSAAARCAGITDDRSWLDCYYGAAQPMRAQLGLPAAPAVQTAKVPPAPGAARVFSVTPPPPAAAPVRQVAAPPVSKGLFGIFGTGTDDTKMASYQFDKHGMFTVRLSNGQAWQQISDDTNFAHWRGAASNYKVSVAEGGFGHAVLTVENDGQTYEVRRAN